MSRQKTVRMTKKGITMVQQTSLGVSMNKITAFNIENVIGGSLVSFYTKRVTGKTRTIEFVSLFSPVQSGKVLDAMVRSGLLEGMFVWVETGRDAYLLAESPEVVRMVLGVWEYSGMVVERRLQDRPLPKTTEIKGE